MRGRVEEDCNIGDALGQMLAASNVNRDAGPAPVVDIERDRRVSIGLGVRVNPLFLAESGYVFIADSRRTVLPRDAIDGGFFRLHDSNRPKHFAALIADHVRFEYGWR